MPKSCNHCGQELKCEYCDEDVVEWEINSEGTLISGCCEVCLIDALKSIDGGRKIFVVSI